MRAKPVKLTAPRLSKHAGLLFGEHPLRALHVYVKNAGETARVVALPERRLMRLTIHARTSPTKDWASIGVAALATAPMLRAVEQLELRSLRDATSAWVKFFTQFVAPRLSRMELLYPTFATAAYSALVRAPGLPGLRTLVLHCPAFAHEGEPPEQALAVCGALAKRAKLETLILRSWHVRDDAFARCVALLAKSRTLSRLGLEACTVGQRTRQALKASRF